MAGYSTTPLAKKLGIKPGLRVHAVNAPENYPELLAPLPEDVTFAPTLRGKVELIHVFVTAADDLARRLATYRKRIVDNGVIWVSWPKKAANVPTDVTEDVVRELALPLGLVDVKVCAVDETWSGLKLMIRVAERGS